MGPVCTRLAFGATRRASRRFTILLSRSGCPRPRARGGGRSRRSRYQSISERSVSRNSRIRLVSWPCELARRRPAHAVEQHEQRRRGRSCGRRWRRRRRSGGSSSSGSGSVFIADLLERDLEGAVLEAGARRRSRRQRRRQHDSPLLGPTRTITSSPDLLQAEVALLGERDAHAQRRARRCRSPAPAPARCAAAPPGRCRRTPRRPGGRASRAPTTSRSHVAARSAPAPARTPSAPAPAARACTSLQSAK